MLKQYAEVLRPTIRRGSSPHHLGERHVELMLGVRGQSASHTIWGLTYTHKVIVELGGVRTYKGKSGAGSKNSWNVGMVEQMQQNLFS